jgi:hypothetical protein
MAGLAGLVDKAAKAKPAATLAPASDASAVVAAADREVTEGLAAPEALVVPVVMAERLCSRPVRSKFGNALTSLLPAARAVLVERVERAVAWGTAVVAVVAMDSAVAATVPAQDLADRRAPRVPRARKVETD